MQKIKSNSNLNLNNQINELQKNPLFSNIKIDINNFSIAYNISLEDIACKKCSGILNCPNTINGYTHVLNSDGTVKCVPCKIKADLIKRSNANQLIKTLYMPRGILEANLDDFDTSTVERKKAIAYTAKFVSEFSRDNFVKGLYLYAPFGSGKTYLLGAIANELSKRGIKSLLMYFPDLVRTLKAALGTGEFENIINELKNIDVLMIDDLGGEMLTSWLRDEIIGPVLNYRVSEGLPIFISSNLNMEQMTNHFEQTKDEAYNRGGDTIKSGRIMERIKSLSAFLDMGNNRYKK